MDELNLCFSYLVTTKITDNEIPYPIKIENGTKALIDLNACGVVIGTDAGSSAASIMINKAVAKIGFSFNKEIKPINKNGKTARRKTPCAPVPCLKLLSPEKNRKS